MCIRDRLENVQKGLGEMKGLAQDVGGLKKVLSNVKTRGTFGEVQLGALLDQMLSPEQYEANVKTKKNATEFVEFAIKLPGKENNNDTVYLPVDAKFPKDVYEPVSYTHLDVYKRQKVNTWTLFRVHTPRLRFLNLKWTTTRILTKTLSVRSICPHGKNSACSA